VASFEADARGRKATSRLRRCTERRGDGTFGSLGWSSRAPDHSRRPNTPHQGGRPHRGHDPDKASPRRGSPRPPGTQQRLGASRLVLARALGEERPEHHACRSHGHMRGWLMLSPSVPNAEEATASHARRRATGGDSTQRLDRAAAPGGAGPQGPARPPRDKGANLGGLPDSSRLGPPRPARAGSTTVLRHEETSSESDFCSILKRSRFTHPGDRAYWARSAGAPEGTAPESPLAELGARRGGTEPAGALP